jgi:hypothetical protein
VKYRAVQVALTIAVGLLCALPAHAGEPCERVVSFFLFPYQGSALKLEWRIWDPSMGKDRLFLSCPGGIGRGFDGVRWDTTFDHAWFAIGDSLYRIPWRFGAKPHLITSLPSGARQWWLNPDNGCWQALRIIEHPSMDEPAFERYAAELWQSAHDGSAWHLVRADSVEVLDLDSDRWQWIDGTPVAREAPTKTLDVLASESWEGSWDSAAPIDTANVTLRANQVSGYLDEQWLFLPMKVTPRRGLAFRLSGPGAPEYNWQGVDGPFYFVDLDRRTKELVKGTDEGASRSLASEHCGFLLIPGWGVPRVIDSSGRQVFTPPWNAEGAVWVPRPRP